MYVVFNSFLLYNCYGDCMRHIRVRTWVKVLFFLIIILVGAYLYSRYVEPKFFQVKEYSIVDSKLPSNFYGLKIVQISDIHYKIMTDENDLNKIVKEINLLKPDVVIFNGDLFDNNIEYTDEDYDTIKKILNNIEYR